MWCRSNAGYHRICWKERTPSKWATNPTSSSQCCSPVNLNVSVLVNLLPRRGPSLCVSGTDRKRQRGSVPLFTANTHISISHIAWLNHLATCSCNPSVSVWHTDLASPTFHLSPTHFIHFLLFLPNSLHLLVYTISVTFSHLSVCTHASVHVCVWVRKGARGRVGESMWLPLSHSWRQPLVSGCFELMKRAALSGKQRFCVVCVDMCYIVQLASWVLNGQKVSSSAPQPTLSTSPTLPI